MAQQTYAQTVDTSPWFTPTPEGSVYSDGQHLDIGHQDPASGTLLRRIYISPTCTVLALWTVTDFLVYIYIYNVGMKMARRGESSIQASLLDPNWSDGPAESAIILLLGFSSNRRSDEAISL